MATIHLKRNDARPLILILRDETGRAVDLTDALSATFAMRQQAGPRLVETACSIPQDGRRGEIHVDFQAGDLSLAAIYDAEVEVTWNGGAVQTFPPAGHDTVVITPDIA